MNVNTVVRQVVGREGKKKSVNIAQVREIVSIMSDMLYRDSEVISILIQNGKRRAKVRYAKMVKSNSK